MSPPNTASWALPKSSPRKGRSTVCGQTSSARGFVRTPLVDKQIPEQAQTLGISAEAVIREVMLKETVDGEFTTAQDVAEAALFFASFESNAMTGQSLVVSHGWFMQ